VVPYVDVPTKSAVHISRPQASLRKSEAYASLPPYAHELYGREAPAPAVVTRRLRRTGTLLRRVPARLRWQLPPQHILRAMARLGPGSRPAPYEVRL
jgi:hypothetical protein